MSNPRHNHDTGPLAHLDSATDFELDGQAGNSIYTPPKLATDRYQISKVIAIGGMGEVFLAHDRVLHRDVALKILRDDRKNSPLAADEFVKEALILSYLSHPGVTPIYELGKCQAGRPYHVMKLVNGTTLQELLRGGQTGTAELLRIFTSVCQTMAFAHSRGVLHLDLKPSNIMVVPFGDVNVLDWGLAQRYYAVDPVAQSSTSMSITSKQGHPLEVHAKTAHTVRQPSVSGTPEYMSPEQARGGKLEASADVFSLGGILSEILCGQAPYQGSSLRQIYRSAANGKTHRVLEKLRTCGFDNAIVRIAIHCLNADPNKRPPNAMVLTKAMVAHQDSTLERVQSDMDRFFELSLDLFCIADLNGFFVRVNSNFIKVLGYSKVELLSRPFMDYVHEDDRDSTIDQMKLLNQGKPVIRFRNRYKTASGNYVKLEWTAKSIETERLIFAVARDVTDRYDG